MDDPNSVFDPRITAAQSGNPSEEITAALQALVRPDQILELRAFNVQHGGRYRKVVRGFYDDHKALVADAVRLDLEQAESICITVDDIEPGLLKHSRNCLSVSMGGDCTTKAEVRRWRQIGLDFDQTGRSTGGAKRPATDDEHRAALKKGMECARWLQGHGAHVTVVDSGNGCQIRLNIDLPPDKPSEVLVQRVMSVLAGVFDDASIAHDPVTGIPGRVWKLPGTVSRKGPASTSDRPWRRARILVSSHPRGAVNDRTLLEKLSGSEPHEVADHGLTPDFVTHLTAVGFSLRKTRATRDGGVMYEVEPCPFASPPHRRAGKAWIAAFPDGRRVAGCHSPRCQGKRWSDVLKHVPALAMGGDDHLNSREVVCLADVAPRAVDWLWGNRLARAKVHLWYGDPGCGKGLASAAVTAVVTTGGIFPGETGSCSAADVLLCNGEDGAEDVLQPRIAAAGGDLRRVHVVRFRMLDSAGMKYLAEQIAKYKPGLLFIDPLFAFSGPKVDLNRGNQTRPIFTALARLAEEHQCAVVVIHHTNKSETTKALQRAAASQDIVAAARVAHLFGFRPGDERHRAMISVKSNLGPPAPTLGYSISDSGLFKWTGESSLTSTDVLGVSREDDALREAITFVQQQLSTGPKPAREVQEAARAHAISLATLRRAAAALKVEITGVYQTGKRGIQEWVWHIPEVPDFASTTNGTAS